MIYEIRSYQVDTENAPEFERLFGDGYAYREAYSPLTGFWRTVDQPLSEMVHVWPYEDLADRAAQRAAAVEHPKWPPPTSALINRMIAEVVIPFDFVESLEPGTAVGPVFEIRYDYFAVSDLKVAGQVWADAIQERSQHDSLVLAGRLEFGQTNGIVQIWGYSDEDRRAQAAAVAANSTGQPDGGPVATSTVVKRLAAASFSPLQ